LEQFCVVENIGHFGNYARNTQKVLKYSAGEGWRRSVRPMCEKWSSTQSPGGEEYPAWRTASWIGHILRRNCFLKHVIEEKIEGSIEVTGRRGRRRKQLLDDLKTDYGINLI